MNSQGLEPSPAESRWTCPFCMLLCDHLSVKGGVAGAAPELAGGDCPRARAALRRQAAQPAPAQARVDGQATSLDAAVAAAAQILRASRQALFGGLGTDVAGARALYRLACATGAICDPARGEALMQGLRALQDRGSFTATLAEVRTRADVVVLVGGMALDQAPLLLERIGISSAESAPAKRHVVLLGGTAEDAAQFSALMSALSAGRTGLSSEVLALQGDLLDTLSLLAALVDERRPRAPSPALVALAERLRAASYSAWVAAPAQVAAAWPQHGALAIEAINRIVGSLNRSTRAAALWLGGGNGAATVNQVFAWLSGLPLRSRAGPLGLEHEPYRFDTERLLADGAADALLWVASFDPDSAPPPNKLPLIVLGHPDLAPSCARAGSVFIPVSTPGIGSAGHLFRTDGVVLLPLYPVRGESLPGVAEVVLQIAEQVSR